MVAAAPSGAVEGVPEQQSVAPVTEENVSTWSAPAVKEKETGRTPPPVPVGLALKMFARASIDTVAACAAEDSKRNATTKEAFESRFGI